MQTSLSTRTSRIPTVNSERKVHKSAGLWRNPGTQHLYGHLQRRVPALAIAQGWHDSERQMQGNNKHMHRNQGRTHKETPKS